MKENLRCFIIDDDEDDREIFMLALKACAKNAECLFAVNGKDALDKLNDNKGPGPDYIFLDLNMPVLNGKETLKEIKKDSDFSEVPVIIYTTSSYQKDIDEVKLLGAAHFLVKPSNIDNLSKALCSIFEKRSLPFVLSTE